MKYEMIPFGIEEAAEIMKRRQLFPVRPYNDDKNTEPLFFMPPVFDQDVM